MTETRQEIGGKFSTSSTTAPTNETELPDAVAEMKYLASCWLDQFEQQVFEGKTISEMLDTHI